MCLGDKPERAYRSYRQTLAVLGHQRTVDYLADCCAIALDEGMLPHTNAGLLSAADMEQLKPLLQVFPDASIIRGLCTSATTASGRPGLRKAIRVLNHELATVCARHPQCRYDGGAANRIRWSKADLSTLDYYHPSSAGHRKIAFAVWTSGAITRK